MSAGLRPRAGATKGRILSSMITVIPLLYFFNPSLLNSIFLLNTRPSFWGISDGGFSYFNFEKLTNAWWFLNEEAPKSLCKVEPIVLNVSTEGCGFSSVGRVLIQHVQDPRFHPQHCWCGAVIHASYHSSLGSETGGS